MNEEEEKKYTIYNLLLHRGFVIWLFEMRREHLGQVTGQYLT